jgi:cytoskeletal protein RodZ
MDDFIKPPKKQSFKDVPKLDQMPPEEQPAAAGIEEPPVINLGEIDDTLADSNNNETESHLTVPKKRKIPKKLIIIIAAIIGILIIGGLTYWFVFKPDNKPKQSNNTSSAAKKSVPKAKPVSPLTGVELTDANLAKRPVTGLMIENSPEARPQSGIIDAGIVFEAVAEGGITRFLTLYQESQPQYIGPIRSARPYYIDFALPFEAGFGHVGGSPDALNDIKNLGARDLDQFFNSGAYWRITERYAPHNVYTSFERLDVLNQSKGYTSSKFTPFERKKDVPQTPAAANIDFRISSPLYSPHYQYDPATNSYKRSQGGAAHVDQKSNTQISPKVVIALVMDKGLMSDGSHTTYKDTGYGKMYVFQDGIASEGTWAKTDRKNQITFTDKNGLSLKLNAGQTWISIVGASGDVTYTP